MGKNAHIFKARYLHRNDGSLGGMYQCGGHAHYPVKFVFLPAIATATGMESQKSAEAP
ncbi:MAG: hypothetical protein OXE78_14105 [Gammaproteobacteria bacterium]|nr:hypothetical protein [Gammaproteobacteria bacterium]